jgi:hypothetical protein
LAYYTPPNRSVAKPKYSDIADISIKVVMNGPLATAGSTLISFNKSGMDTAMIGATNTVNHKDRPTTNAILKGLAATDGLIVIKISVITNAKTPIIKPLIIPVIISRYEFFLIPSSFFDNILNVTASVCVATLPADPEISG